ncbi:MAG: hypothetical protein IPP33_08455 [Flavobacteriales bacterium]|nr:hypothetical protein [Flavobacteriales bacterium]
MDDSPPLWRCHSCEKERARSSIAKPAFGYSDHIQCGSPYNTDLLRGEDVERIDTRQNAGNRTYLGSIKFDIATTQTINLTVGGSLDYNQNQGFDRNNSLLNAENNTQTTNLTYRVRSIHTAFRQP